MDSISEQRLADVIPPLAALIRQMAGKLATDTITIRVTQGLRTWDEQKALYAQGRTAPGTIVTNAKPGYSYHNFGLAVDVVPLIDLLPDWNTNHPVWQHIVDTGVALGLVAGAKWRTFPDYPHFQLTGTLPVSPDDNVRTTYLDQGITGVWLASGLDTDGNVAV